MLASRVFRSFIHLTVHPFDPIFPKIVRMSANKIVEVFNEIDKEMIYIKNKLDSLGEFVQGAGQGDSTAALQKLRDENKSLQRETLDLLKQISVHDVLEGKPPLALKVFMQAQAEKAGASTMSKSEAPTQKEAVAAEPVRSDKPAEGHSKKAKSEKDTGKTPSAEAPQGKGKDKTAEKSEGPKEATSEAKKEPAAATADESITVARLDFRVGKIVEVEKHPDADSLYVEKIDLGEGGKLRTIVSGLVKHVPIEEMKDRLVVVLANLKPAKMRGVNSEGMVMCASTPEKVEILIPPKGSQPGDRISFEGFPGTPDDVLNPKKKIWETLAPEFGVNPNKVAVFRGIPFVVAGKGQVVSPGLINCIVK
ncbi:Aminoacyl tRNA synthase complex-interacting multifunctional protein 1 [Hypsibius exemplaris]|uniref:Aminoacyl tRNA synthase complex-interacting multifunctional protein 1 n=1 Tax=Hypsibius exemplaris TaxID=2072580 RepID=A0A1W0WRC2_HYPEX|nr:Aminoacyl tRNA synthase complex-interacting multifunctional protein 1 [Hypsibius exemplaris]